MSKMTISLKQLAEEQKAPGHVQCMATKRTRDGFRFCLRNLNHLPPHRGMGCEWS
jgi:hypothetical protein